MGDVERNVQQITLWNLAGGAADELFIDALAQVVENVGDPNTLPGDKRTITMQFIVVADDERRIGNIEIKCNVKLADVKHVNVPVYFGKDQGMPVVVEAPRQTDMFPRPESRPRPVEAAQAS